MYKCLSNHNKKKTIEQYLINIYKKSWGFLMNDQSSNYCSKYRNIRPSCNTTHSIEYLKRIEYKPVARPFKNLTHMNTDPVIYEVTDWA